jgi:hypothetical protein
LLYDLKARQHHVPDPTFIDPDVVEAGNVGRQLFTPADLGLPKAEVIAKRLSYPLGLPVAWIPDAFDPQHHLDYYTLLCGAVDNHLSPAATCAPPVSSTA